MLPGREFQVLLISHQQLSLRQLKNGTGSPKLLLIDIKSFSFSSLVMDARKPFVSFPNVLFHLDACLLPTDDPSPAATGPAGASKCRLVQAAHRLTGTFARGPEGMPLFETLCSFFCLHWEREHLPSSQELWEMLIKSTDSTSQGCWGWKKKKHHVYNARTVPSTWKGHSFLPTVISIIKSRILTPIPSSCLISN